MRNFLLIVVVGIIAYANSLGGVYVADDDASILNNPHIRHLWPDPFQVFSNNEYLVATARPILTFSYAINYAIHGFRPEGYHIFNIAIHILSAILIFLILCSTFREECLISRFGENASFLSLAISILWLLHPLNTSAVTYISQRAESLMSFFMLLTLCCVIGGFKSSRPFRWYAVAVVSCMFGMWSKEVAIVTPILVLLYDRTFVCGSFREALQKRKMLYIAFAVTMVITIAGILLSSKSVPTYGLHISPIEYLMTQTKVLLHYIKLVFWPHPLILYYWWPISRSLGDVLAAGLLIVTLLFATGIAFWKYPYIGFLGAWFFITLAPSSSIYPIPLEIAAEHRMYLPLVTIITLAVITLHFISLRLKRVVFIIFIIAISLILGFLTYSRNRDYYSDEGMWRDVIAKDQYNPMAYGAVTALLNRQYRYEEAIIYANIGISFAPNNAELQANVAATLIGLGRFQESIPHSQRALELEPDEQLDPTWNLGLAYFCLGKYDLAFPYLERACQMAPEKIERLQKLINSLVALGKGDLAIDSYKRVIKASPENAHLPIILGDLYLSLKKPDLAIEIYLAVLKKLPNDTLSEGRLAIVFASYPDPNVRNPVKAIKLAEHACQLTKYSSPELLDILGAAYAAGGHFEDATDAALTAAKMAERMEKHDLAERIKLRATRYKSKKALEEIPY